MKEYKHIFFDLDHTLWDFERNANETLSELHLKYGLHNFTNEKVYDYLKNFHFINNSLWDLYNAGKIEQHELRTQRFEMLFKEYIGFENIKEFSHDYLETCPCKPYLLPGALEVLQYLTNKKYLLHIITNGFADTQFVKIKSANIHFFFQNVFTSSLSGFKKPDKQMFEFALSQSNAQANESIMIGDTIECDVEAPKLVGIDSIYFNPASKLHNAKPDFEIKSLEELKGIL